MKRFFILLATFALVAFMLCGCAQKAEDGLKDAASAVNSGVDNLFETRSDESAGRAEETAPPTENVIQTELEEIGNAIATEWQDMVDDGTVEDGDGFVGDRENTDGDGNTEE